MEIENIAGVSFTSGGAAQQKRDLAIRPRVLGEIIVNDECVLDSLAADGHAVLHDLFAHGASGVWRDVLQRGRVGSIGAHDDGIFHRAVAFQDAVDLRDRREFLPDGDIDADDVLAALVDDRIQRDGRLAGLPVANNQFALAAANRNHRVNGFDASLHGHTHRLAHNHVRRDPFDGTRPVRLDRSLAVNRQTERVHHAPNQRVADRHGRDARGPFD